MADTILITSVLLLDFDGKRLWHAAAPSLPRSYCSAINGAEIGPTAGSCGTAAFKDRAVYVSDIAEDPLWSEYRHLALPHGLRACWSTPIHDDSGVVLGTFAIYHRTSRLPTPEEVEAISLVTGHVAAAIQWARDLGPCTKGDTDWTPYHSAAGAPEDKGNDQVTKAETRDILRTIEEDFGELAQAIEQAIEELPDADVKALERARQAAQRGAAIARSSMEPD
jgi:GAF domain-containing protein